MGRMWLTLPLIGAVCALSWSADEAAPSCATLGLRGPVGEFETIVTPYELTDGVWRPDTDAAQRTRWTFDTEGRCTTLRRFALVIQEETAYTYAPSGRLSTRESTMYDWQGRVSSRVSVRYDQAGAKIEEVTRSADGTLRSRWSRKIDGSALTVEYREYEYSGSSLYRTEDTVYDPGGRIVRRERWQSGAGHDRWAYSYDAGGRLERATFSAAGAAGSETWSYRYDAGGRPEAVAHRRADGSLQAERAYRYEQSGSLSSETVTLFGTSGSVTATVQRAFDGSGRATEETYGYAPQSFSASWSYEYGAENRILEQARTDTAGRSFERWRRAYDATGATVLDIHEVKGFETGQRIENVYDASDRLVASTTYDLSGKITARTARAYDGNGLLVEDSVLNPDGSLKTAWSDVYSYDEHGNWVSRLKLYTDNAREEYRSPREETRRILTYAPRGTTDRPQDRAEPEAPRREAG